MRDGGLGLLAFAACLIGVLGHSNRGIADANAEVARQMSGTRVVDGVRYKTLEAAYADLPPNGGRIYISAGNYSIPLGTLTISKPVTIECENRSTTFLNFTGTKGTAFIFNYANSSGGDYRDWGNGIKNCSIVGPGGFPGGHGQAGTGIQIGDRNHATIGFSSQNNLIAGFRVGTTWGNSLAWGSSFRETTWLSNVQDVAFDINSSAGSENVTFGHCVFGGASFQDGMTPDEVEIAGTAAGDFVFDSSSFDGAQLHVSSGRVKTVDAHHENPGGNTTVPYIVLDGSGYVVETSPDYYQDNPQGYVPASFVRQTGGSYVTFAPYFATNSAMTRALDNAGGAMQVLGIRGVVGTFSDGAYKAK